MKLPSEEDLAVPDPESQLVAALHATQDWAILYMAYLTRGELPTDELLARQIVRRCKSMVIHNGVLHKQSTLVVFQTCVSSEEGCMILNEIHAGDCGHHAGSRSLVSKAFSHGFYWWTAHSDVEDIVCQCHGCKKFGR